MSKISLILVIYYRNFCWFTEIVTFFVKNCSSNFVSFSMNKISHLRVLFLLILVLTADWAPCGDGCEGDTEEEQQEGDQEDQGELLLQVGHPAGLATIFNFIQPVGRASSLSCSSHRGYKHCSLDARQGWGSSHGLDEKATTVVSLKYKETTVVAFFAVPVNIKWRSWTNDRFVCAITHSV